MLKYKLFQDCSIQEKEMILTWRNTPFIREQMVNNKVISLEDHLAFIDKLSKTEDCFYYLVYDETDYLGVINITGIKCTRAELGLYKNPNLSNKRIGSLLMETIIEKSQKLGIKNLVLKVLKTNIVAIGLYKKYGFFIEHQDDKYEYMSREI